MKEAILIRRELTNGQWVRIGRLVAGKKGDKGRSGADNRLFVDAVLWILRTGAPWRDLPGEFGNWNSVYVRFRRWARKGLWERLFRELAKEPDFEHVMIDATIVRAHQHSAGAKGGLKIRRLAARAAA
jgi:putative transposase